MSEAIPPAVVLSVVVPVRDEEESLAELHRQLGAVLRGLGEPYELLFVDDGSTDGSPAVLRGLAAADPAVRVLALSRGFGHQAALTAGLDRARGEAVITLDADLQDPPALIPRLVACWREGYEVVLTRRVRRRGEGPFKRAASFLFYRLLRRLTDVPVGVDAGDFRLLDRRVVRWLRRAPERHRYLRGLVGWAGFRRTEVPFERQARFAGRSKYPPRRMFRFALDAITSFSTAPLRAAVWLGLVAVAAGLGFLVYVLHRRLVAGATVPGWASIVSLLVVFHGITLLLLGVLGEYVGRIYEEVKRRPLYVVRERIGFGMPPRGRRLPHRAPRPPRRPPTA